MANRKRDLFLKRRTRVRNKLKKMARGRLRMSVHRSSKNLSVQIIDDAQGVTLASASTLETPRRVTSLARIGYDRLFAPMGGGRFRHEFGGGFREMAGLDGSDVEAAGERVISITPLKMPTSGSVTEELRAAWDA